MDPFIVPLIFVTVAAAIGTVSYFFNKDAKLRRSLKKSDAIPIGQFKHADTGKIVGRVKKINTVLTAPLSHRPCVFYQIIVEQRVKSGKSHTWKTIIHDQDAVHFMVSDGAHEAYIEMKYVQASLVDDVQLKSNSWSPPNKHLIQYLNSKGKDHRTLFGSKTLRYKEGILHIGETVAIKGTGFWELKPDPAEQRLIMKGEPGIEMIISDDKSTLG